MTTNTLRCRSPLPIRVVSQNTTVAIDNRNTPVAASVARVSHTLPRCAATGARPNGNPSDSFSDFHSLAPVGLLNVGFLICASPFGAPLV